MHDIFVIYLFLFFLQNDYNLGKFPKESIKPVVAERIYGDKSAFYSCGFLGLQDTLWGVEGRHYFNDCYIEGVVDFIRGDGQSFYQIKSIKTKKKTRLLKTIPNTGRSDCRSVTFPFLI